MAVQKGKRRRKSRRRDRDGEGYVPMEASEPKSASVAPARRRGGKPLKERSPIVAAGLSVLCVIGAILTAYSFRNSFASHPVNFAIIGLYLVLAAVQAFLAVKIYQARGGWQ